MSFATGHQAAIGVYTEPDPVGPVIERLKRAGFRGRDISLVMPAKPVRAAHVAIGAAGGAALGGGFGWLAGLGALGIPGVGPFIAAGPLLAVLAGAGIGGTLGGIAGALSGIGVPEYEARRYEGLVKEGNVLVSVHIEDRLIAERAMRILRETGARDISIAEEANAPTIQYGNARPITRADDYQFHK